MKKLIFIMLALCLMGAACEEKNVYPKEISFTEYSLKGTSCQWKNFEYDYSKPDNGKVLIINSNEELENYIDCTNGTYPQIDFSKQTLITAWGVANNGIHNMEKQLIQTENNKYQLNVDIKLNHSEMEENWMVAILVEKLSDNTIIELSTEMTH